MPTVTEIATTHKSEK